MRSVLTILLTLLFINSKAQQEVNLYNGTVPNAKACTTKEIWNNSGTGRGTVKNVTIPTLKIFLPAKRTAPWPAVIICPGGGYNNLSIFDGGYETAEILSKAGIACFVLKYRLSDTSCNQNNSMVPLQDAQQAMYIIKKNAAKWNVDTSKIGYVGFSAGGHLSAMASTQYDHRLIDGNINLRPAFTILAYPVISFTPELTSNRSKTKLNLLGATATPEQIRFFSPELNVTAETPPAFLIHASDDSTALVGNSIAYYEALHKAKVPAEMRIYQKGDHGFANYNEAEDDHWWPLAVKWLQNNGFLYK